MKSNHRNEQLEKFFQHNPIEDPQYLKKYVKEHPDHKMAWYLLGREYTAQGKTGKAAYCFAQAGEIYEAFEQQKIVLEGPVPTSLAASILNKGAVPVGRQSKSRGRRKWLLYLVLFVLLALPAGMDLAKSDVVESVVEASSVVEEAAVATTIIQNDNPGLKLYYSDGDWGKKLQQILLPPARGAGESVIMEAPSSKDGQWKEWHRAVNPLLSVEHTAGAGGNEAVLKYYQDQICSCEVADSSKLMPTIASWMHEREEAIILQSAIQAYQSKTGGLPDNPQQLTKPYPDNLLPGLTPQMKEAFPEAVQRMDQLTKAGLAQVPKQSGSMKEEQPTLPKEEKAIAASNDQTKASPEPFVEPLRIVIDTEQHQLAVVSGEFILRRYPVGLGGAKTPQGDFIISEKVRNPNGRSNGEFGSRGMTLSDTLFAIHGTNKPKSIGKDESHGCVRMLQADVEELYNMVPQQTKVTIGKGVLPPSGTGDGIGAGGGNPQQAISLPLETKDNNPGKVYRWLD